jgi:histone H3/H4
MTKPKSDKHLILPSTPFHRLVREITASLGKDVHYKKEAIAALQDISEQVLVELFLKSDLARQEGGRKTLHLRDMKFAKYITDNKELLSDATHGKHAHLAPIPLA